MIHHKDDRSCIHQVAKDDPAVTSPITMDDGSMIFLTSSQTRILVLDYTLLAASILSVSIITCQTLPLVVWACLWKFFSTDIWQDWLVVGLTQSFKISMLIDSNA
jgi:hypothetical protein